jgi:multicomponent Na+:H+ antiporter subunit F
VSFVYGLVAVLGLAGLLACYRLLRGPTAADRVVALDLLFAIGIALCLCAALASGHTAFLDVALGLALVGFVATMAWARLVERGGPPPERGP